MTSNINLKEIEQKAYGAFRQDGLSILFAGISLGIVAIFFIDVRHGWVFALGICIAVLMPEFLRSQLVYPRIGYAQFPRPKGIARHVATVCLAVICLILFYALGKVVRFNWLMPLFLAVVFSAVAFVAARRFGLIVYYVLTFVFLLSGFAGLGFTMRDHDPGWVTAFQLWGLAVILIPVGLVQLARFLRKYSKPERETKNDDI
jgi:hypothetical protein